MTHATIPKPLVRSVATIPLVALIAACALGAVTLPPEAADGHDPATPVSTGPAIVATLGLPADRPGCEESVRAFASLVRDAIAPNDLVIPANGETSRHLEASLSPTSTEPADLARAGAVAGVRIVALIRSEGPLLVITLIDVATGKAQTEALAIDPAAPIAGDVRAVASLVLDRATRVTFEARS